MISAVLICYYLIPARKINTVLFKLTLTALFQKSIKKKCNYYFFEKKILLELTAL